MTPRTRLLLFLLLPALLILFTVFQFNRQHRNRLSHEVKKLALNQGNTIQSLLNNSGQHLLEKGETEFFAFLNTLFSHARTVYIGAFKNRQLVHLSSRYEGYFPADPAAVAAITTISTPVGRILNIRSSFTDRKSDKWQLHLGFNYNAPAVFQKNARRNFVALSVVMGCIILLVISLVVYFDRRLYFQEMELNREKQIRQRFQELSMLTAEIAHEIKNPLNSINLSFSTLQEHIPENRQLQFYSKAIKNEIRRISGILDGYSDLSREVRPVRAPIDLKALLNELKWVVDQELSSQNISIAMECKAKKQIVSDAGLLKQILLNLIKNSAEAGADRIDIRCRIRSRKAEFSVTDNGRGIQENETARVFKPYFSTKTKGMGLGLHITRKLVLALGGEIRLDRDSRGHTRFSFFVSAEES